MRFILNFIFFGVLFYAIYVAFPDAFHTLVSWADKIYEFLRVILLQLLEKAQQLTHLSSPAPAAPEHALFLIPCLLFAR